LKPEIPFTAAAWLVLKLGMSVVQQAQRHRLCEQKADVVSLRTASVVSVAEWSRWLLPKNSNQCGSQAHRILHTLSLDTGPLPLFVISIERRNLQF